MRPDDLEMLEKKPGAVTFTEGEVERAMRKAHGNAKATLRELGIEIVPDPEPEPPPKPWRLDLGPEPLTARIRDANDKIIVEVRLVNDGANIPDQVRWLMALVSAYNAAGERKRIEFTYDSEGFPTVNGKRFTFTSDKWRALGAYIKEHASDLGLEIVES